MKRTLLAVVLCYSIAASGCRDSAVGKIELYDKSAINLIDTNAAIEVIGRNYKWSEGPVWVGARQMLLFSDVIGNKIYRWSGNDTPVVYLTPSGYTDSARRDGENGSNGLTLDRDGRLLLCQSGNRQVVRMAAALDAPVPKFTVLSSGYQGKKFNSPNDLVTDSKGNIYFTDPIYGLPKQADDPTRELKFEGVYRISAGGETVLLIDSISRPNGIALSPDEKTLYVGSSDDQHPRWYAYQLDTAGKIQSGGVLLDGTEMKARASVKQGADGFKVDGHGNIFSSGPDGVVIISPEGKVSGLIKIFGRPASNCAFNETKEVLYITADDVVLRVKLHKRSN